MPREAKTRWRPVITSPVGITDGITKSHRSVQQLFSVLEERKRKRAEEDRALEVEMAAAVAAEEERIQEEFRRKQREEEEQKRKREESERQKREWGNRSGSQGATIGDTYANHVRSLFEKYKNICCDPCTKEGTVCRWSRLPSSFCCDRCYLDRTLAKCAVEGQRVRTRKDEWRKPLLPSFMAAPLSEAHSARSSTEMEDGEYIETSSVTLNAPEAAPVTGKGIEDRLDQILEILHHMSQTQDKLVERSAKPTVDIPPNTTNVLE
ncbi:hypothetical protein CPB86DRAFT_872783 [Serendipita vermifera]|nr:hypothetical protein CPB86DRAFT_872783 [Serendipita vermifera]